MIVQESYLVLMGLTEECKVPVREGCLNRVTTPAPITCKTYRKICGTFSKRNHGGENKSRYRLHRIKRSDVFLSFFTKKFPSYKILENPVVIKSKTLPHHIYTAHLMRGHRRVRANLWYGWSTLTKTLFVEDITRMNGKWPI